MNSRVSVVIATRDYGHYLADALRSVQRQTFTSWDLLVIDDGSRDHTADTVRPFLTDRRIRYIRSDTLGQSRAKNLGLRLSRSPLISYLDGDDVWLPTKLERQVRLLQTEKHLGVVFCRRFLIDPDGLIRPSVHEECPRGMIFDEMLQNNFACFSSVMVRREVLEHVGAFDNQLELAIDYDLWLRVARSYAFDYIDEALVKYRMGHANLSSRLSERITSVLSTMRRCLFRRSFADKTPRAAQREAWGSTSRAMAFISREKQPVQAVRWYLRAAVHDRRWVETARALMRCMMNLFHRRSR